MVLMTKGHPAIEQFASAARMTFCGDDGRFRECRVVHANLAYVEVTFRGDINRYSLMWEPRDGYLEVYLRGADGGHIRSMSQANPTELIPPLDWDAGRELVEASLRHVESLVRRVFEPY